MPHSVCNCYCDCDELEGQPHTRGCIVTVIRVLLHGHAVQLLSHVHGAAGEQIVAGQVERHVRREPPGEPSVDLGAQVARITLREALSAGDRDTRGATG